MHVKLLLIALLACMTVFAQETESTPLANRNTHLEVALTFEKKPEYSRINVYGAATHYFNELIGITAVLQLPNNTNYVGAGLSTKYAFSPSIDGYMLVGPMYVFDSGDSYQAKMDSTVGLFIEAGVRFIMGHGNYIKCALHHISASSKAGDKDKNLNHNMVMVGYGKRF
ncbi:MAG: hypothetical protein LBV04_00515 [Deferribacteraceae bacterium]|jgi:hypothetical protein|nr:hypothetical protein [Deferribacteraceae bacterium]